MWPFTALKRTRDRYSRMQPHQAPTKIVQCAERGFCALVDERTCFGDAENWCPMKDDGTTGTGGYENSATLERLYWVSTEAEAGGRIDLRATKLGVSTVWSHTP